MADGKTMPKGKGKGKGKKEGGRSGGGDDDAAPAAKNGGKGVEELEGFVTSVDGTEGVVTADLPEGGGVEVRVKFSPAPPGKGSVKDGKKEVKFKSIAVLAAPAPAGEAGWEAEPAPTGDTDAEAAQHEAPQPPGEKQGKERVIRDDDECFVADYTGAASNQPRTPKFEQFDKVRRARIARELVDIDPEVELRIRKHPSKDAEEIRVITAEDTVEVVGTCGEWLRLAGNDEQWIKYLQSENPDIPEQLVDVLGPSILSVASSLTSGWFSSGAAAPQDDESSAGGAAEDAKAGARGGGGGWGFGGWGKSLSSYVPLDTVSALSSRVLAAGGEGAGPAGGDGSLSDALREAQTEGESNQDIAAELTESVEKKFDKEVKLDDGGLASVRMASQAISMFEGSLGWLSSSATTAAATVQEKAKTVRETVTSEEFVDKAWSNVKSGVQAGGSVAVSATKIASSTTSAVVNSGAVNRVTAMGKSAISSVGSTSGKLISSAKTTLLGEDEVDETRVYPNRALGGVVAIELSGCIIARDPHVEDEDEDPFLSDDYSSTPMVEGAIEAVHKLVHQRFQDRVYLTCVAAPQVQARMLRWLSSNQFYNATGTTREKVHFCREWDEKADVCKELGVTVVVEASSSSAGALESVVETALLFGDGTDVLQGSKPRQDGEPGSQALLWWDSVCAELLPLTPELPAAGAANAEDAAAGSSEREEAGSEKQGRKNERNDAQKQQESQQGGGAEEEEEFFSGDEGGGS